jgi:hypothetical protein
VKQGDEHWNALVAECLSAREYPDAWKRNWALGDIALRVPLSDMGAFALDAGINKRTLVNCRITSRAWPPEKRNVEGVLWSVYQDLASRPELMRPGLSSDRARDLIRQEDTGRPVTVNTCPPPHITGASWLLRRVTEGLERLSQSDSGLSSRQKITFKRALEKSLENLKEEKEKES